MIGGKQYNRGVTALKIVYEALQRLNIEVVERWLRDKQNNNVFEQFLENSELQNLINGVTQDSFQTTESNLLFELYETFEEKLIYPEFGSMSVSLKKIQIFKVLLKTVSLKWFKYY